MSILSSPIILSQFILSILQIGANVFMVQNMSTIPLDRTVAFIVTGVVALIELFIYCYFGDLVTSEGREIAHAVYAMPWEKWSARMRRHVCVVMMRTQQQDWFQGMKMVNCSLTTYTSVRAELL